MKYQSFKPEMFLLYSLCCLLFICCSGNKEKKAPVKEYKVTVKELNHIIANGFSQLGIESGQKMFVDDSLMNIYKKRNISVDFISIHDVFVPKVDTSGPNVSYINRALHLNLDSLAFFDDWNKGKMNKLMKEFETTENQIVYAVSEPLLYGANHDTIYFEINQKWHSGKGDALWFVKKNGTWVADKIEGVYVN